MPIISEFYGLKIYMYFNDHNPPHIHAEYQGKDALFDFDGNMVKGFIPNKQKRMVQVWIELRLDDLYKNWQALQNDEKYSMIEPLK